VLAQVLERIGVTLGQDALRLLSGLIIGYLADELRHWRDRVRRRRGEVRTREADSPRPPEPEAPRSGPWPQ
jgi:hypothetical protein